MNRILKIRYLTLLISPGLSFSAHSGQLNDLDKQSSLSSAYITETVVDNVYFADPNDTEEIIVTGTPSNTLFISAYQEEVFFRDPKTGQTGLVIQLKSDTWSELRINYFNY